MNKQEIQAKLKEINDMVIFIDKPHSYKRVSDGKTLVGVTTMLSQIDKPFLVPWAAKEAVKCFGFYDTTKYLDGKNYPLPDDIIQQGKEKSIARYEELKNLNYDDFYTEVKNAKGAYRKTSSKALKIGDEMHEFLEIFVNARIYGTNLPEIPKHLERPMFKFIRWEQESKIEWIASEAKVISNEHLLAGTLDGLAYVDGKLTVIDFKTSKQISDEYFIQTAAYSLMLEEFGIVPVQRIIVKLPKTIDLEFEVKVVPTPLEFDKEVFLALTSLKKWIYYCKNNT